MHSELALKIAREKLRLDSITTLHLDTTAGTLPFLQAFEITNNKSLTNKLFNEGVVEYLPSGKEVFYSTASFAGKDQRSTKTSNNQPPFVVSHMLSELVDTTTYSAWLEQVNRDLQRVSNGTF